MTANRIYAPDPATGTAGFISFPGVIGNNISTPITPDINILGDICIVAKVTAWDVPGGTIQTIAGRYGTTSPYSNQRSWFFSKETSSIKRLRFSWSSTGSSVAQNLSTNLAVPDDSPWVAVCFQPAVPACKFWYSTDGVNWTERGLTGSATATAASMWDSTAPLIIGSIWEAQAFPGDIEHVSIRSGVGAGTTVGGTEVFRYDGGDLVAVDKKATSFTSFSGHVMTVNRSGSPATELFPKRYTPANATEFKDLWIGPRRVWPLANGYLDFRNGGAFVSPTTASLNLTGDLDVRWFGYLNDWNGSSQGLLSKFGTLTPNRSWLIQAEAAGVRFYFSTDGSAQVSLANNVIPFADGVMGGIRFTRVKSTGVTTCWFSNDGENWTPQATTAVLAAGSNHFASAEPISIGGYNAGLSSFPTGHTAWAEVRDGIDGPVVYRVEQNDLRGVSNKALSFPASTGQTVERRGASEAWIYPTVLPDDIVDIYQGDTRVWPGADGYVSFFGTPGNYLSTPGWADIGAPLSTALTLIAKIRRHGGTWDNTETIAQHRQCWSFDINVTGWGEPEMRPRLVYEYNNHTQWSWVWGDPMPDTDDWVWIAVTFINDTGGSNKQFAFWLSYDGTNWLPWRSSAGGSLTLGMSTDATKPLYIGAEPEFPIWSNLDLALFSIREGTGASGTVGGTEVFRFDRSSVNVTKNATTLPAWVIGEPFLDASLGYASTADIGPLPTPNALLMRISGPKAVLASATTPYRTLVSRWPSNTANVWAYCYRRMSVSPYGEFIHPWWTTGIATQTTPDTPAEFGSRYLALTSPGGPAATYPWRAFTSPDGVTWTQYGGTSNGNQLVYTDVPGEWRIGHQNAASSASLAPWDDRIYWIEMRQNAGVTDMTDPVANTTLLWRFDASDYVSGTSWTDARGRTWTLSNAAAIVTAPFDLTDDLLTVNRSTAGVTYTDNFDRADGPLGGNWNYGGWAIASNAATRSGGGSDYAVYLTDLGSPDHWAEADITPNGQYGVVNVRRTSDNAETGYLGFWDPPTSKFKIGKSVAGSYSDLAVGANTFPGWSGGLRLEVQGSTINLYASSALQVTVTDTSITTGNYAGINANVGPVIDDFEAAALSGGVPLAIYPTVSEMQARWGVSQYGDGTKWVA